MPEVTALLYTTSFQKGASFWLNNTWKFDGRPKRAGFTSLLHSLGALLSSWPSSPLGMRRLTFLRQKSTEVLLTAIQCHADKEDRHPGLWSKVRKRRYFTCIYYWFQTSFSIVSSETVSYEQCQDILTVLQMQKLLIWFTFTTVRQTHFNKFLSFCADINQQ